MERSLNVVVSSGGTAVPIDDVRILTNRSKGKTGALIAEEALKRGHDVDFVHAENAKKPFEDRLKVDPTKDIEEEVARLRGVLEELKKLPGSLKLHLVRDFFAYQDLLLDLVRRDSTDVAIVAMAASDYGPEKVDGKISSDGEELLLKLRALPKIITQVKAAREAIFLVGFKLLTEDSDRSKLLDKAFASMRRDRQDLAVANIVDSSFKPRETYIITPQQDVIEVVQRENLPTLLISEIEKRLGTRG